jgi:hypothetical protein
MTPTAAGRRRSSEAICHFRPKAVTPGIVWQLFHSDVKER